MMKHRPDNIPAKWRKIIDAIPGYDSRATAGDCVFDVDAAELALEFFPECLHHVKGAMAGKPFVLEPWQSAVVANLFGWKRPDGTRRYREAFVFVPRKNGKSAMAAGLLLEALFCDNEPGAEIYGAASEYKQASLVFDHARGMVLQDSELMSRAQIFKGQSKAITTDDGLSSYRVISSDADTKHGYNTHFAVIDELHTMPNSDLVDTLQTSTGARQQPMIVHITTSDYEREGSICNEKHDYASKVRDGVIEDESFLPVIYEAKIEDDWTSPEVWKRANPNLGISLSLEYLERECARAQEQPRYENTFKRLHLNIRTEQADRWIQLEKWDACGEAVNEVELRGQACYGGLDLASTTDIAALVLDFPITEDGVVSHVLLPYFWVPGDNAIVREKRDKVPYLQWAREGHIEMTPGNVIDYGYIRKKINELAEEYDIQMIAADPWNATQTIQDLEADGINVFSHRQGFASMNEPSKAFEKLVLSGQLRHGGNPVLRWMASNVAVDTDPADNIKPSKKRSTERIDGIPAAIMAIGRATLEPEQPESYYETHTLEVI